jgi:hypothetical protein
MSESPSPKFLESVRNLAGSVVSMLQTRLELASVELAEARPADEGRAAGVLRTRLLQHGADDVHAADRHRILGNLPLAGHRHHRGLPRLRRDLPAAGAQQGPQRAAAVRSHAGRLDKDREMLRR